MNNQNNSNMNNQNNSNMDNQNNNNDFMSIFNGDHVDVEQAEKNINEANEINNQNIQMNNDIQHGFNFYQTNIDDNTPKFNPLGTGDQQLDIDENEMNNKPMKMPESKKSIFGIVSILIIIAIIVVLIFGGSFTDKIFGNKDKKDPKKIDELVENSNIFGSVLREYVLKNNITVGFSCTSDSKDSKWYNSPGTVSTVDCTKLMSDFLNKYHYNKEGVIVDPPDYGTVVFSNSVISGTELVYGEYTCIYNGESDVTCK